MVVVVVVVAAAAAAAPAVVRWWWWRGQRRWWRGWRRWCDGVIKRKGKGKGKGKGKVKAAKKEVAKALTAMYVRSAKRGRGGSEVRRRWPTRSSAKLAKRSRTKRSRQFE